MLNCKYNVMSIANGKKEIRVHVSDSTNVIPEFFIDCFLDENKTDQEINDWCNTYVSTLNFTLPEDTTYEVII